MADEIRNAFREVFRDFTTDGVPSSGKHKVKKSEARDLGDVVQIGVDGAAAGVVRAETWTVLSGLTGTRVGQPGQVMTGSGTHTDPVSGSTVPNKGEYRWSASPAGWRWTSDLLDTATLSAEIDTKADQTDLSAEIAAREAALPAVVVEAPTPLIKAGESVLLSCGPEGLDGPGLAPWLRRSAVSDVISPVADGTIIPLVAAGERVLLWLDSDGLRGPGLNGGGGEDIAAVPTSSDGRSLWRMRAKLAALKNGIAGTKLKIAFMGDSWSQINRIPLRLIDLIEEKYTMTGLGFLSVEPGNRLGDTTLAHSGWTSVDGSGTSTFPYGTGPDGNGIYADTATATLSITDIAATTIKIMHLQHGGTFRYRIDGGAYTTVTANSSGTLATVTISGLSDTIHSLEIDTTGNAGVVSLAGFYLTRDTAGVEVHKMGNGGLIGQRMLGFTSYMQAALAQTAPDVAIVILGTNDYRNASSPPSVYLSALDELANACKAAVAGIGLIFVAPPQSDGVEVVPLSAYRDALNDWCRGQGYEFLNIYDQFGSYAQGNALGLWEDTLHLNNTGSINLVDILNTQLLHL